MTSPVLSRPRIATVLAKRGLRASGYYRLRLRGTAFPGVAVLCYHGIVDGDRSGLPFEALHVTSSAFEEHCQAIASHCSPVSMGDVIDAVENGRRLPQRPVLVTFDDGYRSVFTSALPILARYRIPATVFAATDAIARQELFWFDAAFMRLGETAARAASQAAFGDWKAIVEQTRTPATANALLAPLTIGELRALSAHPLLEIGGHTASHPSLQLTPSSELHHEIAGSMSTLSGWIGKPIRTFAYPYGYPGRDYSQETVAAVRNAGFSCAFSTGSAFALPGDDRLQLPRFVMLSDIDASELLHRLTHSWHRTV